MNALVKQRKAVALKANIMPVVKSAKLPAVQQREYQEFDEYVRAADSLRSGYDELFAALEALQAEIDAAPKVPFDQIGGGSMMRHKMQLALRRLQKCDDCKSLLLLYSKFDAGRRWYEREELYEEMKEPRCDLLGGYHSDVLTRRVVSEQVAMLIGSFPNANPHSSEVYVPMLIEEIIAANPRASALESTCREIRRTKTFLPAIAEVLKVLREQAERLKHLWLMKDDLDMQEEVTASIATAKAKLEEGVS